MKVKHSLETGAHESPDSLESLRGNSLSNFSGWRASHPSNYIWLSQEDNLTWRWMEPQDHNKIKADWAGWGPSLPSLSTLYYHCRHHIFSILVCYHHPHWENIWESDLSSLSHSRGSGQRGRRWSFLASFHYRPPSSSPSLPLSTFIVTAITFILTVNCHHLHQNCLHPQHHPTPSSPSTATYVRSPPPRIQGVFFTGPP